MIPEREPQRTFSVVAIILLVYSMICFATMFYLDRTVAIPIDTRASAEDSTVGPFTVPEENTVYEVRIDEQLAMPSNTGEVWNAITVSLLDANQQFLMGWSDEVWSAAGRDSEGPWRESRSQLVAKITIPKRGVHFLRLQSESNLSALPELRVRVLEKVGSTPAFTWLGSLAMLGALVCWYMGNKERFS